MLQCMQCQEKTCAPWISSVTSAQKHFNVVFPQTSNEFDVVVRTPDIMLSVSRLELNFFCVSSIFHML